MVIASKVGLAHSLFTSLLTTTVLWPLFHYLLWQDVATEYASADSHYPHYESANAAFARKIAEIYQPGDLIWVHDYHLLLVPRSVPCFFQTSSVTQLQFLADLCEN